MGVREVFSIATGAMISSGLFVLPGVLYLMTGPSVWVAYLLAAVLVVPALCCKVELATAMPKAGGTYYFIDRALGPAMGTLGGFAAWFSLSFKTAFALFGVGAFCLVLDPSFTDWQVKLVALAVTGGVTVLNIVGVKSAARAQNMLVLGLLLALGTYVISAAPMVQMESFDNFLHGGWNGLAVATGSAFVAFGGLTKAASMAEEVKHPGSMMPRALFLAFFIVTALYLTVVFVTVGVLGDTVAGDLNPVVHGAEAVLGRPGLWLMSAAALTAFLTTGNAGVMAASRTPMAMSRDKLLPIHLETVHARTGTPVVAIIFTSAFIAASVLFLDLETLIKTASVMKILLFLLVNVAVIVMRESRVEFYRPTWRVPLYPVLPVFGVVAYAALSLKLGWKPIILSLGFLGSGLVWYALYARIRVHRESAILNLVGRFADNDDEVRIGLEAELRTVLRDRDGVEADEFDDLVAQALLLDLGKGNLASLAEAVGNEAGEHFGIDPHQLATDLFQKELKSPSVMVPGMAVPLLKIPGEDRAQLVLVRSRDGLDWPGVDEPVRAVCVLLTSKDRRHERLRVVTYIAQIAHDPQFGRRWMRVRDLQSLPELLAMSKRNRETTTSFLLVD